MKRGIVSAFLLCAVSAGLAATKPNFSGTWVLDKGKSFSNGPGLDQTIVVAHDGDRVKLEAKVVSPRGEQLISEEYTLDGKDVEFTPPTPTGGQPPPKGKRRAAWLPGGRGIVVVDETVAQTANGPVPTTVTRKWLLSPDGATLTIDYFIDRPNGGGESKRVFIKK